MFIDIENNQRTKAPEERNVVSDDLASATFRSSGALPSLRGHADYKHFVPMGLVGYSPRRTLLSQIRLTLRRDAGRQQSLYLAHDAVHFFLIGECDHEKLVALMEADHSVRE
jgi:hypothetical protein